MATTSAKATVEELIRRAKCGAGREKEEAVEELIRYVRGFSARYLTAQLGIRDRERVNDLSQEVSVTFYYYLDQINPNRSPCGLIVMWSRHQAIDLFRQDKRRRAFEREWLHLSHDVDRNTPHTRYSAREMEEAIRKLPRRYSKIVERNLIDGLKPGKIALELKLPPKTVYRLLNSGKEKLRTLFQQFEQGENDDL